MRDHGTALRRAYIEAFKDQLSLDGVLKLPVVDGKVTDMPANGMFVVFGAQTENDKSNKDKWVFETSIDVAIVDKRKATAGKKDVEAIGDQMLQLIFPTVRTIGIDIETPFNISFIKYSSGVTEDVLIDTLNHPVQVKRFQFINRITQ